VANRFLDQLEESPPPSRSSEGKQNRFLQSIEGVEFAKPGEGALKSTARTLSQIPLGAAQRFTWPADVIKLLSEGASREQLAQLAEEEPELKGPVAESARQRAMEYIPTQGSLEQFIEEKTGAPITPQNKLQKGIRLGSTAAAFRPKAPLTAGVTAPAVATGLEAAGVPEQVAEPVGLVASGVVPSPSISKVIKPSGLPARRFESVTKPTKVTPGRYEKIHETVEQDFRKIADQLLEKNPTYSAMKQDNLFKEKISDLFDKVEDLSENIPGKLHTEDLRDALRKRYSEREVKGITPDEFEKAFRRELRAINKSIPFDEMSAKQMVDQFRKNNKALKELFEPGKSSAYNRAKKESLLEYNRAIEDVINKKYPDSEFKDLFEFTNKRWQEINDIEEVDKFMADMFEGKVNYAKAKELFRKDKEYIARPFKRILGEQGYQDFKALTEDLLSSEKAMSYIKEAKNAGFADLAKLAGTYLIHPKLAAGKLLLEHGKIAFQMLLDKPQLAVTWKSALDNLKSGKFEAATRDFTKLDNEVKDYAIKSFKEKKAPKAETIEKGKKALGETLETNPEFKKQKILNEPERFIRKVDIDRSAQKPTTSYKYEKEWDKYFPKDLYQKYYYGKPGEVLGKLGDIIKDSRLKRNFKEIEDVPIVTRSAGEGKYGTHEGFYEPSTKKVHGSIIYVEQGLSPHKLQSTLAHEGTHALQTIRIDKKTGHPKIYARSSQPHKNLMEYWKDLNEVSARKFQNWIDQPVNRYRSELEKTRKIIQLLKEQHSSSAKKE
jgi:hypothetical protein